MTVKDKNLIRAEQGRRIRQIIRNCFAERAWWTVACLLICYPWLLKIAVKVATEKAKSEQNSPFVYVMR